MLCMTPDRTKLARLRSRQCDVLPVNPLPQVPARQTLSALTTELPSAAFVLERKVKVTPMGTPSFSLAGPMVEFLERQPI